MRYRIMASYRGASYEAGVGPGGRDVVLFAACPPPEELGFEPATGHWRKELTVEQVQGLWQVRPLGYFRGQRCLVLDDLGDELHVSYVGTDRAVAVQIGYAEIERGVFELVVPRDEVTGIVEERTDYRRRLGDPAPGITSPEPSDPAEPLPLEAAALAAAHAPPTARVRSVSQRRKAAQPTAAQDSFAELAEMAGIPASAYSLGAQTDGAMCLLRADDRFEVFTASGGARHDTRWFADEESAYFYLFGVLAAEAVRIGTLGPRGLPTESAMADDVVR